MSSTVNEVYARYCRTQVDLSPTTLQHTLWALNLLCKFIVGRDEQNPTTVVDIHSITRDTVEDWRAWLVERGLKRSAAKSAMSGAAPLFRWAANREEPLIPKNPFLGVKLFRVEPVVVEFTQEEIDRMLAVANLRWQGMIRVAVTAGAERSLVQNLVWDDFDLEQGLVRVSAKSDDAAAGTWQWRRKRRGTHGESRIQWLPVSEQIGPILGELRMGLHPKQPYPFVPSQRYWELRSRIGHLSAGTRNSPDSNFAGAFNRVLELAKVPKAVNGQSRSFHDLRVTFATNALRNNLDLKSVQDLMGHADAKMTLRYYTAVDPEACRKARNVALA